MSSIANRNTEYLLYFEIVYVCDDGIVGRSIELPLSGYFDYVNFIFERDAIK